MAHYHRDIQEDEVLPALADTPAKLGDLLSDPIGLLHVVIPDSPQMRGWNHGRSSAWVSTAVSVD
jgi:hypothetical protein